MTCCENLSEISQNLKKNLGGLNFVYTGNDVIPESSVKLAGRQNNGQSA